MSKNLISLLTKKSKKCFIFYGDSRTTLAPLKNCVDLIITSPPYANARAGHYNSVDPNSFAKWFSTFHPIFWDILKPQGSLVINLKDKIVGGVRHRFVWEAIQKLSSLGWLCIEDYIWCKKNPMPGFLTARLHDGWEYCFHLAKEKRPFIHQQAVKVLSKKYPTKLVLPSNVLHLPVIANNPGHPAVFPLALPSFFIKLLSPLNGVVLDPFSGSGTTGVAAALLDRRCILVDDHKGYCNIAYKRILKETSLSPSQIWVDKNIVDPKKS